MKNLYKLFVVFFLFFYADALLFSQDLASGTGKKRGDYLTIKIAEIGPGDQLYFWWGHLGLVIDDAFTGKSFFYDYGVFSFNKKNFFTNFAKGRLLYTSDVSPTASDIDYYINQDRKVTLYTLNLDAQQKEEIQKMAIFYSMPENREYLYNHFSNNCVTRVLDMLNKVLGGQLYEKTGSTPGRFTLREQVRRHTYFSPPADWFLNFVMGQDIDKPATEKENMFLPSEVGLVLNTFYYKDSEGRDVKLISKEDDVYIDHRKNHPLEKPPLPWSNELIFALVLCAIIFGLKYFSAKKKAGVIMFGMFQSLFGLFFGIAGSLVFFMSFFSDHDYSFHNMNVIFVNPILLCAVPLGIMFAFGKNKTKHVFYEKFLKVLWTYVFFSGILVIVLKLLPMFFQKNQDTLALVLPPVFALSVLPEILLRILRKQKLKTKA